MYLAELSEELEDRKTAQQILIYMEDKNKSISKINYKDIFDQILSINEE